MKLISHNTKHHIKQVLSLATKVSPYIPRRGDGFLETAVKVLAIIDKTQQFYGGNDEVQSFLKREEPQYDSYESQLFVELCLNTPLAKTFKTQKETVSPDITILKGVSSYGNVYVIFYQGMLGPIPSDSFYTSKNFDFEGLLDNLWQHFGSSLYISSQYSASRSRVKSQYLPLVFSDDPISESAAEKLEKISVRHLVYLSKGYSRTYLLEGPPGVGKTTFAMRFAKRCGNRILRIDSEGLALGGADVMNLFLTGLKPDFLLIEDIDRVVAKESLSVILDALTNFKERFPKVTVVMTANHIGSIDSAVKRPGRIDRVLRFDPPSATDRTQILATYFKEFQITDEIPQEVVVNSQGLTAAYLKEVAIQFDCGEELPDILESLEVMKNLLDASSDDDGDDENPPKAQETSARD